MTLYEVTIQISSTEFKNVLFNADSVKEAYDKAYAYGVVISIKELLNY